MAELITWVKSKTSERKTQDCKYISTNIFLQKWPPYLLDKNQNKQEHVDHNTSSLSKIMKTFRFTPSVASTGLIYL